MSGSTVQASNERRKPLVAFLHSTFGIVTAFVLAVLALLTFSDVIGRYLFNQPIYGAYELIEVLMGVLIFTALPIITLDDRHITIDLLDSVTPVWLVTVRNLAINLISAAALAVIAWQLLVLGRDKAAYSDVSSFLRIPQAPVVYALAALAACAAAAALVAAAQSTNRRTGPRPK